MPIWRCVDAFWENKTAEFSRPVFLPQAFFLPVKIQNQFHRKEMSFAAAVLNAEAKLVSVFPCRLLCFMLIKLFDSFAMMQQP